MPVAAGLYYHTYNCQDLLKTSLVLIHGAGGNSLFWPPHIRRLAGCRVFALDLPGHGKSGGRGLQSIHAFVQAVDAWMDAAGVLQAVFIGHSMGAAIALCMALQHSERLLGLMLVGGAARFTVNPSLIETTSSQRTFSQAVETLVKWSFASDAPRSLLEQASRRLNEVRPAVLHGDLLACSAFDVTARLSEIHQPVLVLCGAEDKMTPLRQSQSLAASIPNALLEVIPAAGHMVMLEKPQAVAAAILRFFSHAGIIFHA